MSKQTKVRAGVGVGATCVGLALGLLSAPVGVAGGGCANGSADIGTLGKGQAREAVICLFNKARNSSVAQNGDLQTAAQKHTDTMRSEDCFAHECPGEPSFEKRVKSTGYFNGGGSAGEVISFGPDDRSPSQYVDRWLRSNKHRAQITKSAYEDVGVGINFSGDTVLLTAVLGKS